MHRTLLLIRHAKAVDQAGPDIGRALTPRGVADASALARWIAQSGLRIDHALISPARRTMQTWQALAVSQAEAVPEVVRALYLAGRDEIMAEIRKTPTDVKTLAVVGHNPGIGELAAALAAFADAQNHDTATKPHEFDRFPTCSAARFAVTQDWLDLTPGLTLAGFAVPRAAD